MAVSIHSFIGASTRCVPCVHAAWRGVARGSLCISVGFGSGSALVYSFSYRGGHCVLAFLCPESFRVLSLAFAFSPLHFFLFFARCLSGLDVVLMRYLSPRNIFIRYPLLPWILCPCL